MIRELDRGDQVPDGTVDDYGLTFHGDGSVTWDWLKAPDGTIYTPFQETQQ